MTYFKGTINEMHSAVDSLKVCCLKMTLCGRNILRINTECIYSFMTF
jgi:hypothetical protein